MEAKMCSPAEVSVESLLGGMDMETLMAFADSDIEGIYERLQEPFDDLEQRIVVSSMVQEAVAKGFLKGIEEESCMQLASKDMEIASLRDLLIEKDACICDLQKILGIAEDEGTVVGNSERTRSKHLWDFLQESQKKWRESEADVTDKEKELERLASSMASMALMFDNESKRAALLERQLNELKEQYSIKSGQISSFQQDNVKLKLDNSSLKRQARLKQLQFDESMEQTRAELQQQRVVCENLLLEKRTLEKSIEDKNRALSNLEHDYRSLENQLCVMDDKVRSLTEVENTLREIVEGHKLMQEGEQELLMTYIDEQMKAMDTEASNNVDLPPSFRSLQVEQQELSSTTARSSTMELEMTDYMMELTWKADTEALVVEIVMEGWYKELTEVVHKLTFELAWKDEEIFYRDGQVGSLKQAAEELENDYATLMSICLMLINQTDNDPRVEPIGSSVHELGRRKLLELSELLSSRDAFSGQDERFTPDLDIDEELAAQQFQQDLKREIVSEVFKQEKALEGFSSREVSAELDSLYLELASEQFQHKLNLEILSEVFSQAYKEALELLFSVKLYDSESGEANGRKDYNNFVEIEAHLESFMELEACRRELEACRLERIRTGCSTSIAKCEFKLDKLMKTLADQVNEMKAKISFVQDAIKQQDWKHMLEVEILVSVLWDALVEMHHRNLKREEASQQFCVKHDTTLDHPKSPQSRIHISTSPRDTCALLEMENQGVGRQGMQGKDKLILFLKNDIENLRKEKAVSEQKLDEITEELYSLKRQFWKEKEIWVSKLSQHQRKEVEAQVEALSRHSSVALDLEEEFKKIDEARFDALVTGLKKEWLTEKENLLAIVSQKEEQIEGLGAEIMRLGKVEQKSKATEAGLLARIADLRIQADNLSSIKLNEEFHFAKSKQDWKIEKESLRRELDCLLEKDRAHAASEAHLSARIADLETQSLHLSAQVAELDAEREDTQQKQLDQESGMLKLKGELQEARECVMRLTSEREHLMDKVAALSEQGRHDSKVIKELETERVRVTKDLLDRESSKAELIEEREVAFALAIQAKTEEEERRKMLESQLQELRLEVKSLQGLNKKVADLEGKLKAVSTQSEIKLIEQVDVSVKTCHCFQEKVLQMIQVNSIRLDGVKEKCQYLRGHLTKSSMTEVQCRQRLAKELQNLQKAEAEVDLLGDEVESLLEVLEEVQVTFDLYAPVLVHYPKMREVAKLVNQEIQLRIDPKYGA